MKQFVLILSLITGCNQKSTPEARSLSHTTLLEDAKWEIYKANVSMGSDSIAQHYVVCCDTLLPFARYKLQVDKIVEQHDTIMFRFKTRDSTCGLEWKDKFVYDNGERWSPFVGIIYAGNAKLFIDESGDIYVSGSGLHVNDTIFANYLQQHQDFIKNEWLLTYAKRFLKTTPLQGEQDSRHIKNSN